MDLGLQEVLKEAWEKYEKAKGSKACTARPTTAARVHRTEESLSCSIPILHGPAQDEGWVRKLKDMIYSSPWDGEMMGI